MPLQQRLVTMKIPYLSSDPDSEHPSSLWKRKAANLTLHIASSCDASENFISSGSHLGRLCYGLCLYNTSKQASSKYSPKGLIYLQVSFGHGQAIPGSAFKSECPLIPSQSWHMMKNQNFSYSSQR